MREGIKGLTRYIERHKETAVKARVHFNERFEKNPLWAIEGINYLAKVEALREQAEAAERLIQAFEHNRAKAVDDAGRLRYEESTGISLNSDDAEQQLLAYYEAQLQKNLISSARYADNRSTSSTHNLVSDVRISAIATFIDDRLFSWS